MEPTDGKNWAKKYVLDPLTEPEPSAETGPGSHFRSTVAPLRSSKDSKSKRASTSISEVQDYPTPPQSASPNRTRFQSSKEDHDNETVRSSTEIPTSTSKNSVVGSSVQEGRDGKRESSIQERYREDNSTRPLDVIRKSSLRAHRSPHLRKDHHHGVDSIDKLAGIDGAYHLGGPFDVVSTARNVSSRDSPVAALKSSNAEALRATPKEAIIDALRHHRPIDGVASLPPGIPDRTGRVLHYKEGPNLQRGTGENVIGQWPAYYDYDPEDIKGKGEPSFSIERSLKNHDKHKRAVSDGYEMISSPKTSLGGNNPFNSRARASTGTAASGIDQSYTQWESELQRSKSAKNSLPRKLGSLRRRRADVKE